MANDEVVTNFMEVWFKESIDLDINFINQVTMDLIQFSFMMMFYGLDRDVCGSVLHIYDFAGTCDVEVELPNNKFEVQKKTSKKSGTGADLTVGFAAFTNIAWALFTCISSKLKKEWTGKNVLDCALGHISSLATATLGGSGVMTKATGEMNEADKQFNKLGNANVITEYGKMKSGDNLIREIENFGGQPTGAGKAINTDKWNTTSGLLGEKPNSLNTASTVAVLTSNIMGKMNIPESSFTGGRFCPIASSSPDNYGVIERAGNDTQKDLPVAKISDEDKDDGDEEEIPDDDGFGIEWMAQQVKMMTSMKGINEDMVFSNLIGFFVLFALRNFIALGGKTMQTHFIQRTDTFCTTLWGIERNIRGLTRGLWRTYLEEDSFMRTFNTSFRTFNLVARHLQTLMWSAVLRRCMFPKMVANCKTPLVEIAKSVEDTFMAILFVPPSIITVLSGLYIWLASTMLDLHIVVISTFCLFSMNLRQNCPLYILALAARGLDLTEDEQIRFEKVAEWMIMSCCYRSKISTDNQLLSKRDIEPLSDSDTMGFLEKVIGIERENYQAMKDTENVFNARQKMHDATPYMAARFKPSLSVRHFPTWANYKHTNMNVGRNSIKYDYTDHRSIACQFFGDTMSEEEASKRENKMNGTHPVSSHHKTSKFWKACEDGFRLPRRPNLKTDKSTLPFKCPHTTSRFYKDVITESEKHQCGATSSFLKLCGLTTRHSRNQILTTIFKKYIDTHHPGKTFPNTSYWKQPYYVDETSIRPKFEVGMTLVQLPKGLHGLEMLLGMDVVWALVAQGLYCNEWVEQDGQCEAIIHTRITYQAVLVLLSIYLHLQVEKSVIPANNGFINIRGSNPYRAKKKRECAKIRFDERLNLEPHQILSTMSRTSGNAIIKKGLDGVRMMLFAHVTEGTEVTFILHNRYSKSVYPPESSAHFLSYSYRFTKALARYMETRNLPRYGPESYMPFAISKLLRSMHMADDPRGVESMTMYMSINPTFCMTRPGMEMPFITSRYNHICVLKMHEEGHFKIHPVKLTSTALQKIYSPLPITGHNRSFAYKDFSFATIGGLKRLPDGNVACRSHDDIIADKERSEGDPEVLSMVPFYVFNWPHFVIVSVNEQRMKMHLIGDDENNWRYMSIVNRAEKFMIDLRSNYIDYDRDEHWLAQNPDIHCHENLTICMVRRPVDSNFGRTWRYIGTHNKLVENLTPLESQEIASVLYNIDIREGAYHTFTDSEWNFIKTVDIQKNIGDNSYIEIAMSDCMVYWVLKAEVDDRLTFWVYDKTVAADERRFAYFNSREHLRYELDRNGGDIPMLHKMDIDNEDDNFMLHATPMAGEDDKANYEYAAMVKPDGQTLVTASINEFDFTQFFQAREAAQTLRLSIAQKENILETMSDSSVSNLQAPNLAENCRLEITRLQEQLQKNETLMSELQPTCVRETEWIQTTDDELSFNISFVQPSDEKQDSCLGILTTHDNKHFMHKGQYKVTYMAEDTQLTTNVDFPTVAAMILEEGSEVHIRLNAARYRDLIDSLPSAYFEYKDDHDDVLAGKREMFITGFYTVHGTEVEDFSKATMTVLIQIDEKSSTASDFQFDNKNSQKVMINVKIFDENLKSVIFTDRPFVKETSPKSDTTNPDRYINCDAGDCIVVSNLTRLTYQTKKCPHGPYTHNTTNKHSSIHLKR